MISKLRLILAVSMVMVMMAVSANAAVIAIIESQSFNASHDMDQEWMNVISAMGHTPILYPQTALDNGSFISPSDAVVISSGVIPMGFYRRQMIIEALYAGRPVYLQCEHDPGFDTNIAWEEMVEWFGGTWNWQGSDMGNLDPIFLSGVISNTTFNIPSQTYFMDGAYGVGSQNVETTHHWADKEYGWLLPQTADHAMCVTNTDQDWVRTTSDPQLMENYINVLIGQLQSDLQVKVWSSGPISIPNSGGTFTHFAQVNNNGPFAMTFDAWIRVQLPNGNLFGPLQLFTGLNLGAFSTTPVVTLSQNVPGFAPPGQYYLQGVVGQYSWPIANIDAFGFQKMVVAQNDGAPVDNWAATGLDQTIMADGVGEIVVPTDYSLSDPYPNPFNPSTSVSVTLPEAVTLKMVVYDLNGREVATLADGEFSAGEHGFTIDGHGLASGVYFLSASSPGHLNETRRLVLMK